VESGGSLKYGSLQIKLQDTAKVEYGIKFDQKKISLHLLVKNKKGKERKNCKAPSVISHEGP
jgi:hypothetical protein